MRHRLVCVSWPLGLSSGFSILTNRTDSPLTDLYDTEGDGGFPGIAFKARPVVGGHFAFLALERACGGKAVQALSFLDAEPPKDLSYLMGDRSDEL